jgi:Cytochrome oxidase complex assembly protein 1
MNLRKRFTWKRILKVITVVFILAVLMNVLIFYFLVKGEPFSVSKEFLISNRVLAEKLGPVKSLNPSFFSSSLSFYGPDGKARYKIFVEAERGDAIAYINMVKSAGIWRVTEGSLKLPDNQVIDLKAQ